MEAPGVIANYSLFLNELLSALGRDRFAVTPEVYRRVFTVVAHVYKDGLPVMGDDRGQTCVLDADWQTLRELIAPIVVRSESEQKRFRTVFDSVYRQTEPQRGTKTTTFDGGETGVSAKDSRWSTLKRWLFGLGLFALLAIGWLYIRLSKPDDAPPFMIQYAATDKELTLYFFTDSLSATRPDSVWWVFDNDTLPTQAPTRKSLSRDTVSYTYAKYGLKKVTAYRRPAVQSLIARLRGYRDKTDTATVYPFVQEPKSTTGSQAGTEKIPSFTRYSPTYRPLVRASSNTAESQVRRAIWVPWVLSVLVAILAGAIWWWRWQRRKSLPPTLMKANAPFALRFPDQQRYIRTSRSLGLWVQQLQQREEGKRRQMDLLPTIRATIRQGGLPTLRFRQNRQRQGYLVLIDDLSARDQQARLYQYLAGWLMSNEVEAETFLFHADPRQCWNARYPGGIGISDLARSYGERRLVVLTEGFRLLDYEAQDVAEWAKDALSNWASRAILTPVYPEHWNYVEALLAKFFVVLPATPDGQLRLRDFLQFDPTPSFSELREKLGVPTSQSQSRGIFGKTVDEVTVDDVDVFLEKPFEESEEPLSPERLRWWAYATAVYPTTDWNVTLCIGHAIEAAYGPKEIPLVTTSNLLKLTTLPWLRQGRLPAELAQDLLARLPAGKSVEQTARRAVEGLLESKDLTERLSADSIAEQERNVRLGEQQVYSPNKATRLQALRALEPFEQAGLVKDEGAVQLIDEHRQQQAQRQRIRRPLEAAGLVGLVFLPLLLDQLSPPQPQPVVSGTSALFYTPISASVDSAAYYNNEAVALWDSIGNYSGSVAWTDTTYPWALSYLHKSLKHRVTFPAVYNLHVLRYNAGVHQYDSAGQVVNNSVKLLLNSPLFNNAIENTLGPVHLFGSSWVPQEQGLNGYLQRLYAKAPTDSVYRYLQRLYLSEYNDETARLSANTQRINRLLKAPIVNKEQFDKALIRARTAFDPLTPTLLTDLPPMKQRVHFRFTYPRQSRNPASAQIDSLLVMEAYRIILYASGPKMPTSIIPDKLILETTNKDMLKAQPQISPTDMIQEERPQTISDASAASNTIFSRLPALEEKFRRTGGGGQYELQPFTAPILNESLTLNGILCKPVNRSGYYHAVEHPKERIVLKISFGSLPADINFLTRQDYHISVPFVIARDGTIYQLFSPKFWSGHLGRGVGNDGTGNAQDKATIGIELSNYGDLRKFDGNLVTVYSQMKNSITNKADPVDVYCSLNQKEAYQGSIALFQDQMYHATFTDDQYNSLIVLLRFLTAQHNIPRAFLPEPWRSLPTENVLTFKGIVSALNYRTSGNFSPAFDWARVMAGVQAKTFSATQNR